MTLRLWIGLACFVPLALVAADPLALLRALRRRLRGGASSEPSLWRGDIPALAWLPALLVAIIGTGLIGMVLIP